MPKQKDSQKSKLRRVLKLYPLLQSEDVYRGIHHVDERSTNHESLMHVKQVLDDAISSLPLKQRKIIILTFLMDVPVDKICSMLNFKFRVDLYRAASRIVCN
jgi:DNA-directed RNA polymerase specialized sigma24 family protein